MNMVNMSQKHENADNDANEYHDDNHGSDEMMRMHNMLTIMKMVKLHNMMRMLRNMNR